MGLIPFLCVFTTFSQYHNQQQSHRDSNADRGFRLNYICQSNLLPSLVERYGRKPGIFTKNARLNNKTIYEKSGCSLGV